MAETNTTEASADAVSNNKTATTPGPGPGSNPVGVAGIIFIAAYLVLVFFFLTYLLIKVWPHCVPTVPAVASQSEAGNAAAATTPAKPCADPVKIDFFWGYSPWIWDEIRLLLIVMIAGALGSALHSIRSFFWYVGNRDLRRSWVLMYILLPFSGTILAVVFYFIIRGGFFPQAKADQSNPISFAALAGLMGLFSAQASLKLKQVFDTLFTPPPPGGNAKPQEPGSPGPGKPPVPAPKITGISKTAGLVGGGEDMIITGTNFSDGLTVNFGGESASVKSVESTKITVTIPAAKGPGEVDVVVTNKDKQSATSPTKYTYQ